MGNGRHWVAAFGGALGVLFTSSAASAYFGTMTVQTDAASNVQDIFDAPMTMLKSVDPARPFWVTSGPSNSYRFQGPFDNPWQTTIAGWPKASTTWIAPMPTVVWPDGSTGTWNPWMCNIYKHSDGTLIGFVHLEDNANRHGGSLENFKLGIAYSTNGGTSFSYLGDIIDEDNSNDLGHNIKGAPYIIRNEGGQDYFYLYFNDLVGTMDTTSVARAKVSDVMAAAVGGSAAPWKKYHNGAWNEHGIRGTSTSLDTPYWINTHSKIAFSAAIQKYVWASATGAPNGTGNGVALLFSSDGLSWTGKLNVFQATPPEEAGSYASIGAFSGTTVPGETGFDTAYRVGNPFSVYYRRWTNNTLGRTTVSLADIQPIWQQDFNAMADGGAPTGWSIYQDGGEVHIDTMVGTFDRNLHLYDTSSVNAVSAVKSFPATAGTVTMALEFRLNDNGSRQTFRMKGNSSTVSPVYVYAWSGKLYWMDPSIGGGREIVNGLIPNWPYSLKIKANAATDTYDIYFDGANVPTVASATFWTNVSTLDSVAFGTDGPGIGDSYIDDVWVYQ